MHVNNQNKVLKFMVVFVMVITCLAVLPGGEVNAENNPGITVETGNVIHVSSKKDLEEAGDYINNASEGNYTILIDQDIDDRVSVRFNKNTTVVNGQGHIVKVSSNGGAGFMAEQGAVLSLENITVEGITQQSGGGAGDLASASRQGVLNLKAGTVLRDNFCYGNAGVSADNGGTINMYDGAEIQNCISPITCGGVLIDDSSVFNMSGGTIENCHGGWDGAVWMNDSGSHLNITGGKIENCTGSYVGGVYAQGNNVNISNLTVTGCAGNRYSGAVLLDNCGTQNLKNVTIIRNKGKYGGGILAEGTTLDVSDSVIANNYASAAGADICLDDTASSVKLPDAAGMKQIFEAYGSTEGSDLKKAAGKEIDGWYKDEDPRYVPSENGQKITDLVVNGPVYLTASCQKKNMQKLTVTVKGGQNTYKYDGKDHHSELKYSYQIDGKEVSLPHGIQISLKDGALPEMKNAGVYKGTLTSDSFNVTGENAGDYEVVFVIAEQPSVTISQRHLKLQVDLTKVKQGVSVDDCVAVSGDGFVKGEGAKYQFPEDGEKNASTLQVLFHDGTLESNYIIEREDINAPEPAQPTKTPDVKPTTEPAVTPTSKQSVEPTTEPTVAPAVNPTVNPTEKPAVEPVKPSDQPEAAATTRPSQKPQPTASASAVTKSAATTKPVEKKKTSSPDTGDHSNVLLYAGLMVIMIGIAGAVVLIRKKSEN